MFECLGAKLQARSFVIGVIGLGYVGIPLALSFAKKFRVIGLDVKPELIQALRRGDCVNHGVSREDLIRALDSNFLPTTEFSRLSMCDVIIVTVGTPLRDSREPDLSQVEAAARVIAQHLHANQFIILESTSYPGTTEEVFIPLLESSGYRAGVDFSVAYSPERIDPGNRDYPLERIPKVVGGIDRESTAFATELYSEVTDLVVPVSHARVAEAAKMIENIFRSVNIALVNEIALIMERLGVNTWEAIEAASTKPFGFMAFYPGPGVGGHCIPLDPFYLSYRARKAGYMARFIELSSEVNEYMKFHTLNLLRRGLREAGKEPRGVTLAVLGLAFKKNVADTRESPAIQIIEECMQEGMRVRAYDPYAPFIETHFGKTFSELDVEAAVAEADAALILVDHDVFREYDFQALTRLMDPPAVWVDGRNVLKEAPAGSLCFGIGRPDGRIGGVRDDRVKTGIVLGKRPPNG